MNFENNTSSHKVYGKLEHQNVKDLYWLLFSECPIGQNHPTLKKIPFFPEEIIEHWRIHSREYFLNLDKAPNELSHFLNRSKNKRLGFYAEALLSFFFQTFSQIELLLQNYQIIQNGRTLGELDFIIRWKNRVIHIECAVKYYLCDHSKDINDLHSWIGPACKDNLGRKINRIIKQQLPMINFINLNYDSIESYLFLKGKLFTNQVVKCDWIKSDLLGNYFYLNKIEVVKDLKLLVKPFWLSAMTEEQSTKHMVTFNEATIRSRAELVTKIGEKPFFIVPQNWPN